MAGAGASEKSSSAKQSSSAKYQKAIGPSQPKTSFKDFVGAESFDYGAAFGGTPGKWIATSPGPSNAFKQSDKQEKIDKASAAYKRAIKAGGHDTFGTRGSTDVRWFGFDDYRKKNGRYRSV